MVPVIPSSAYISTVFLKFRGSSSFGVRNLKKNKLYYLDVTNLIPGYNYDILSKKAVAQCRNLL